MPNVHLPSSSELFGADRWTTEPASNAGVGKNAWVWLSNSQYWMARGEKAMIAAPSTWATNGTTALPVHQSGPS